MTTQTIGNCLQEKATPIPQASQPVDQPTGQILNSIELQAMKRLRRSAAKALLGFMDHCVGGHTLSR